MMHDFLQGICHQLPARTLVVAGVLLPACARCAGFYLGFLVAFLYYAFPARPLRFLRHPSRGAVALAAAAVVPGLIDTFAANVTGGGLGNWGRYTLALPMGWGSFVLLAGGTSFLRWGTPAARRWGVREVAPGLGLLIVPLLLVLVDGRGAAALAGAAVAVGAVAYYALLTYLPFALFRHGKPWRLGWGAVLGVVCVALALAEMKWGLAVVAAAGAAGRRFGL